MWFLITINGIPVGRAATLGLAGRKMKNLRAKIRNKGFVSLLDADLASQFRDIPDPRDIRIFHMENGQCLRMYVYSV